MVFTIGIAGKRDASIHRRVEVFGLINSSFDLLIAQLTISAFKNVQTRSNASNAFKEC